MRKINEGNINATLALEAMRANLTLHEHRVTDWIDPSALHDHDHDARGFPVELGHGEHGEDGDEDEHGEGGGGHKHGSPHVIGGGAGSELDALLKELEGLSASDLEKSIKVGGLVTPHVDIESVDPRLLKGCLVSNT